MKKTAKLIELKAQLDAIKDDYLNPDRSRIIAEYHAEMAACGRRYFDDRLNAWAMKHGALYGETTMLEMISDGTIDITDSGESLDLHITESESRI